MVVGLSTYAVVWSGIHSLGGYTTAFQVHFGVVLVLTYARSFQNAAKVPRHISKLCYTSAAFLLGGMVMWLMDQFLCGHLHSLPAGLPNPQLHAVWHVFLSAGAFYANTFFAALKGHNEGYVVTMHYSFLLLPRFSLSKTAEE